MLPFNKYYNLFQEAKEEDVAKIKKIGKTKPFEELFKGRERFLIRAKNINFLELLDHFNIKFEDFDLKKRTITGVNINTYLKKIIKANSDMLGSGYDGVMQDNLKKAKRLKQYIDQNNMESYILFSRNPIDVLRMSDHGVWKSCHSLDSESSKKYCAIEEANSGGIVYVIAPQDVSKIKSKLNDPEIFEDKDRGISGIVPIGRLRLRRFMNLEEQTDFAIPSESFYDKTSGMAGTTRNVYYKIILDYLRQNQSIYNNPPKQEDYKDIVVVGGDYDDDGIASIFRKFFGYNKTEGLTANELPIITQDDAEYSLKNVKKRNDILHNKLLKTTKTEWLQMSPSVFLGFFNKLIEVLGTDIEKFPPNYLAAFKTFWDGTQYNKNEKIKFLRETIKNTPKNLEIWVKWSCDNMSQDGLRTFINAILNYNWLPNELTGWIKKVIEKYPNINFSFWERYHTNADFVEKFTVKEIINHFNKNNVQYYLYMMENLSYSESSKTNALMKQLFLKVSKLYRSGMKNKYGEEINKEPIFYVCMKQNEVVLDLMEEYDFVNNFLVTIGSISSGSALYRLALKNQLSSGDMSLETLANVYTYEPYSWDELNKEDKVFKYIKSELENKNNNFTIQQDYYTVIPLLEIPGIEEANIDLTNHIDRLITAGFNGWEKFNVTFTEKQSAHWYSNRDSTNWTINVLYGFLKKHLKMNDVAEILNQKKFATTNIAIRHFTETPFMKKTLHPEFIKTMRDLQEALDDYTEKEMLKNQI